MYYVQCQFLKLKADNIPNMNISHQGLKLELRDMIMVTLILGIFFMMTHHSISYHTAQCSCLKFFVISITMKHFVRKTPAIYFLHAY